MHLFIMIISNRLTLKVEKKNTRSKARCAPKKKKRKTRLDKSSKAMLA